MIAVQLLDVDGGIVSIANVDETFWSSNSVAATTYAQQAGLGIWAATYPPDAGTAECNVSVWGDFTNWVARQQSGVTKATSAPSSKLAEVGLLVALIGLTLAMRDRK
jgi:hypothetical protein